MFESLLAIDHAVFLVINHLPHNDVSNWFALFLSGVGSAGIIWICVGVYVFLHEEKKDHRFFMPIGLVLMSCWVGVEGLLKYIFQRPRPSIIDGAYVIGSASWFSFPSSHAAISFAMATVFSRYEPRGRVVWYTIAFCISFSRIYLGVHYPLDVLVGGLVGWGIGMVALRLHSYPTSSYKKRSTVKQK